MEKIQISPGKQVSISSIAKSLALDDATVLNDIQNAAREHYFRFGTQALQLFFDPSEGYCLHNTAAVGLLKTEKFTIELLPKINRLDIGKCLGLAQVSGMKGFQITDNLVHDIALKSDSAVNLVDYFSYSLLDAVVNISHNGLLSEKKDVIAEPNKIGGNILMTETVAGGKGLRKPYISDSVANRNITPNSVIKTALELCLRTATDSSIRDLASVLIQHFKDVSSLSPSELNNMATVMTSYAPTSPRPDYDSALSHALAILEGGSLGADSGKLSAPSFTLDLDKVFESFCSSQIKTLLNPDLYDVEAQKSFNHAMEPSLINKKIIPDVFVTHRGKKKGVILDLKNKYSSLREDGKIILSNPDLYQISYYSKTLDQKTCILVYPGYRPRIQYPIKSSESEGAYAEKRSQKLAEILKDNSTTLFRDRSIRIIIYNVDLSGSVRNSIKSVAGLCQLVTDIIQEDYEKK